MARIPSNTDTVRAIPRAVRIVVVLRTRRLRRLYENGNAISESSILKSETWAFAAKGSEHEAPYPRDCFLYPRWRSTSVMGTRFAFIAGTMKLNAPIVKATERLIARTVGGMVIPAKKVSLTNEIWLRTAHTRYASPHPRKPPILAIRTDTKLRKNARSVSVLVCRSDQIEMLPAVRAKPSIRDRL
jgi:hypothetical protein